MTYSDTSHEAESGTCAAIDDPSRACADSATDSAAEFPTMPPGMYGAGSADFPGRLGILTAHGPPRNTLRRRAGAGEVR